MKATVQLLVYRHDRLVAARDAIDHADLAGVDPESSGLRLDVDGTEHLSGEWNLGPIRALVDQAAAAIGLLRSGRPAVIRSGVRDRTGLPFHLLEPDGGHVEVSRVFIDDPEIEWLPTVPPDSELARRLYAWVDGHRGDLARPAGESGQVDLTGLTLDRDQLIGGLESVVADGEAVLRALGRPTG